MTDQKQIKKVEQIVDNYQQKQSGKFEELKKLNDKVQVPPRALAYVLGIIGSLVMGVGMCICLGVLAKNLFAVGVVVGVVGIAMMIANVFIYRAFLGARKKKYGAQVLALANELSMAD